MECRDAPAERAIEWAWVLNGSITTYSGPRAPQLWANRHDDFTPFWATRSYGIPGAPSFDVIEATVNLFLL